jgi:hypothetical protein
MMHGHLIRLAEGLVHARPASEDEAREALEWIAARRGTTLEELMREQGGQHAVAS